MTNNADTLKIVRRRRVFYIPGYDPIHPRRYRELYRTEGAMQASISGYEIDLIGRQGTATYGWQVLGRMDGHEVEAEFDVLVWSDIVRDSMELNIPQTYLMMFRTAWTYISTGALRRLMWLRRGPVIAALYPVVALLLQLILALLVGGILGGLTEWAAGALSPLLGRILGWIVLLVVAAALLLWFRKIDNKLFIYYLMHDYSYSASTKGANPPELEARMAQFGDQIAEALATDVDEVLVIGHSSGAHLGVSILSDLLAQGRVPKGGPHLNFLTLGQVVPMVSFLPNAGRLRRDLNRLCQQDQIAWVDVTAPGDGCAFALCDPVTVSGVAPDQGKRWPLVFSAAFTQTLSPERWAELRWRFFRLHFQYLCAFDRPRDYDYFQITAGPQTLRDRYRDRAPSKSRIDVSASKYTSMVP
ncbi:hypothetical protein ALP8811_01044 [Aliiroseovarius pelagivivens]|uniref:Fungal lipase-like domain-containing protein n=1 Tax=Aliiroseovarius pelagivivens TaxID=1639690 RepID=A0A2R8AJK1_9RHOB|nr:hypothetical protein [Aliiroseovarius pelagivivens]SPF76047.1 hypothetical protein ALP8811_01044 [Aliiroseovarius pelagivivens]